MSLRGALVFSRSSLLPITGIASSERTRTLLARVPAHGTGNDILYTERTFRLDRIIEFMVEEGKK
jgi:hypothetical protein